MPDFDVPQVVEAAAEVLSVHRWKSMGVASVSCECGAILYGDSSLTQFPADEAFRKHLARAALAVIVPAVTEQVRAEVCGEDSEEWVRNAGGACMVSGASVLNALDELDAAARGEQ